MAVAKAELMRNLRARRRDEAELEQRTAYDRRRAELGKSKVRTAAHFRRWARQLILDTGERWEVEPFQIAFVRDLFAGRPENWLIVPEGNAKTTLVAGLALYHLEFTLDAAIAVAAAARDQAGLIYSQAEGFVQRSELKGFDLHPGYRRIEYPLNRSRLQIFAADSATGDGIIPTLCLVDELHRQRDLGLYRTWRGKLEKRNAQIVTISTAGEPGSEFEQTRERIRQDAAGALTRKGAHVRAVTAQIALHEWAVPETGDVEDLRTVKAANPLKAMTLAKLRAKLEAPTMTMSHWRRFVCNLPTRSDSAAITEAEWDNAKTKAELPADVPIWLGIDVAWKWDTTALVPLWVQEDGTRVLAPRGAPARILTPPRDGSMLDPHLIEKALTEINQRNPIHTVVIDPSKAEQLASWIEETFGSTVIARGGGSTPEHVMDFERFMEGLRSGRLKHGSDAGLTKHALNAIARVDRFGVARFDRPSPTRHGGPEQERRVIDALTAGAAVHAQSLVEVVVETRAPVIW